MPRRVILPTQTLIKTFARSENDALAVGVDNRKANDAGVVIDLPIHLRACKPVLI